MVGELLDKIAGNSFTDGEEMFVIWTLTLGIVFINNIKCGPGALALILHELALAMLMSINIIVFVLPEKYSSQCIRSV